MAARADDMFAQPGAANRGAAQRRTSMQGWKDQPRPGRRASMVTESDTVKPEGPVVEGNIEIEHLIKMKESGENTKWEYQF
eukprot:gene10376-19195_t